MKRSYLKVTPLLFLSLLSFQLRAAFLLVPMDEMQTNHLKAYGLAFKILQDGVDVQWLLNYRGGSFLFSDIQRYEQECAIRGISFQVLADAQAASILTAISDPEVNQEVVKLEKAPKIAVYSPKNKMPWDDAVTLCLTYAEIPYDVVYDEEVISGKLPLYDWLHLHHEDFTGQYGRFWAAYKNAPWYQEDVRLQEAMATKLGFTKVSQMKLAVAQKIRDFVSGGGYLFAMCSATDSYDIALSAEGIDICEEMFDGDAADPAMNKKVDYAKTFAFRNYKLSTNPYEYEFSDIDNQPPVRKINRNEDLFTLFEFSA
ncbi:MAG: asparagine synthetase B, partial [Bacteroidota bacterium]